MEIMCIISKVLDPDISLHKGPAGEPEGGSLAGTLERKG